MNIEHVGYHYQPLRPAAALRDRLDELRTARLLLVRSRGRILAHFLHLCVRVAPVQPVRFAAVTLATAGFPATVAVCTAALVSKNMGWGNGKP